MTDAEINQKVSNFIANTANELLQQASPFPSDKLEYTQQCVCNAVVKLRRLHDALEAYNKRKEENLLRLL